MNQENDKMMMMKENDVEAPKAEEVEEDPSVVVTADDSSVGTEEANEVSDEMEKKKTRVARYGPLSIVVGISAVILLVILLCPSLKQEDSLEVFEDAHKPNCDKNGPHDTTEEPMDMVFIDPGQDDGKVEGILQLPTELPFPDVAPVKAFGPEILKGYNTLQELEDDLTLVTKHFLNRVILQNIYNDMYYAHDVWNSPGPSRERPVPQDEQDIAQVAAQTASVASARASKTNNQEESADEADLVKNDESYVYAAFGDHLVVWDHDGNPTTQVHITMEPVEPNQRPWPTYINGLVLTPNHVVALVDYHGSSDEFFGSASTQVFTYTKPTSTNTEMTLVSVQEFNGTYRDGRWMEESQSLQLLISHDINTFPHLIRPLQSHRMNAGLTPQEYLNAATLLADHTLIPDFVKGFAQSLLQMHNGDLSKILQINSWSTEPLQTKSVEETIQEQQYYYYGVDGPARSFLQVVTLDPANTQGIVLTTSTALTPTSSALLYATGNHAVVAMMHPRFDETTGHTIDDTFLLHLQEGSFHSVATLPGRVAGAYSIDIQGDDLRVATTLQKWFPMDQVWPNCGDGESWHNQDECVNSNNWNQCFDLVINGCPEVIKTGCPYEYSCVEGENGFDTSSTDNYVIVLDISTSGTMVEHGRVRIGEPHEVITAVRFGESFSYAMTFDQRDPFYVLKLEPGEAPEVSGSLKLNGFSSYLHPLNADATLLVGIGQNVTGTGLEMISTGVMITVFDVSNPNQPLAVASHMLESEEMVESHTQAEWDYKAVQYANGKLVIPVTMYNFGWHQLGDDEVFFNVGMEDFVEDEEEESGVSRTGQDSRTEKEDFEGFMIFTVGYTGIQEAFRVNHIESGPACHYCNGGLANARSILFDDGNLMTMSGEFVQSNNIYTGRALWNMTIEIEGVEKNCCW